MNILLVASKMVLIVYSSKEAPLIFDFMLFLLLIVGLLTQI